MYVHQLTNVWIYKDKVSVLPDCVRHFACKLLTSFTPSVSFIAWISDKVVACVGIRNHL
jgi:hypothetical protein